ncbi:type VI secretion system-associated protein TagF [Novosphingobium sp. ERN07]|uniref:type VI secretion system-associated protein TagF n=1 Tax=Novosphingobium sp. ERN07 TaxID=2726187 RepID=UPI00145656BA|nr:type VI secretion system-associated protein TagF [Novosphingobium sp. ERN07]NLR72728.1 type VI secretion system-associated protein TagF [Novosphingobium sp. ERN07]
MPDGAVIRYLFGKLPAHGDFVSRGLDTSVRDELDRWLTAEMERAQAVWEGAFDWRYEAAPVWHFVDEDGNGGWSGGILCASADRVGRRFPLIFAASAPDCAAAVSLSAGCLVLVGQGFAEGWDADCMVEAPLAPESLPWQPKGASWALVGEDGPVVEYQGRTPTGVIERMLEMAA